MIGQRINGQDASSKTNSFRQEIFAVIYGIVTQALTWAAAQTFSALATFNAGAAINAALTITANLSGVLVTINQQGTGDVLALQDGGVPRWRFPDGGGIVVVPQAGGVQVITGLVFYDNTATGFQGLKFQHEGHPGPVPIDPRNGVIHTHIPISYP